MVPEMTYVKNTLVPIQKKKIVIQYNNSIGYINNKVNELYSLFLKFSAFGLLQDIRNNFHSYVASYLAVKIVSDILKKAKGRKFEKE